TTACPTTAAAAAGAGAATTACPTTAAAAGAGAATTACSTTAAAAGAGAATTACPTTAAAAGAGAATAAGDRRKEQVAAIHRVQSQPNGGAGLGLRLFILPGLGNQSKFSDEFQLPARPTETPFAHTVRSTPAFP